MTIKKLEKIINKVDNSIQDIELIKQGYFDPSNKLSPRQVYEIHIALRGAK